VRLAGLVHSSWFRTAPAAFGLKCPSPNPGDAPGDSHGSSLSYMLVVASIDTLDLFELPRFTVQLAEVTLRSHQRACRAWPFWQVLEAPRRVLVPARREDKSYELAARGGTLLAAAGTSAWFAAVARWA
jgi:hypothetical protein